MGRYTRARTTLRRARSRARDRRTRQAPRQPRRRRPGPGDSEIDQRVARAAIALVPDSGQRARRRSAAVPRVQQAHRAGRGRACPCPWRCRRPRLHRHDRCPARTSCCRGAKELTDAVVNRGGFVVGGTTTTLGAHPRQAPATLRIAANRERPAPVRDRRRRGSGPRAARRPARPAGACRVAAHRGRLHHVRPDGEGGRRRAAARGRDPPRGRPSITRLLVLGRLGGAGRRRRARHLVPHPPRARPTRGRRRHPGLEDPGALILPGSQAGVVWSTWPAGWCWQSGSSPSRSPLAR